MTIKVGAKVSGKVTGITNFGAFVKLENGKTGLVHISEISDRFIKDIHNVLKVGDTVTVKVMKIANDGKINLSMKRALPESKRKEYFKNHSHHSYQHDGYSHGRNYHNYHNHYRRRPNFNNMMSKFLKQSESRLSVIRKNTEGKRGGRGGRRS